MFVNFTDCEEGLGVLVNFWFDGSFGGSWAFLSMRFMGFACVVCRVFVSEGEILSKNNQCGNFINPLQLSTFKKKFKKTLSITKNIEIKPPK